VATSDNAGRVRVGPRDKVTFWDAVWPHRHGKWWNWDAEQQRTENADDLLARMPTDDLDDVQDILRRVESVAQTAVDRAEATERRATTITGSVAIAASFTVGGAGLLLDDAKWNGVAPCGWPLPWCCPPRRCSSCSPPCTRCAPWCRRRPGPGTG
jgi:hypothetical protein